MSIPGTAELYTLILAAMAREVRPLARALSLAKTGVGPVPTWQGGMVMAASVGVGSAAAAAATSKVLDLLPAGRVLVVGVAGARDPALAVGDVVAPEVVVDAATGRSYRPTRFGSAARRGTLVTLGHLGAEVADSPQPVAVDMPPVAAVDMESAAIAGVCEERGIPWDVRRAISDLPGTVVPSLRTLVRDDGRTDLRAVVRLLVRQPSEVRRLVRLGQGTRLALRSLTSAVTDEIHR